MRTLSKLIFIFFLLVLLSCKENKIEFTLINNGLNCKTYNLDSVENFYGNRKFKNENEVMQFTNIVSFKVTNSTNKKQLLFLKNIKLHDLSYVTVVIEDEMGKKITASEPLIDPSYSCKLGSLMDQDFYTNNEENKILVKMKYDVKGRVFNFVNQEVIIPPNDSYILYTSLSLPFVVEDIDENLRKPIYYRFDKNAKYTFRLRYHLDDDLEKKLPKDLLQNYKENNIEIFKGEIETQKIPIVFME